MESIDPVWLVGAIALALGLVFGALINRAISPSSDEVDDLRAELDKAHEEMTRYRTSVDSHFEKTSELVNELTQDYVKVYRHLAEGAQTLSNTPEFNRVLEQSQNRVLISLDDQAAGDSDSTADGQDDVAQEEMTTQADGDNGPTDSHDPAEVAAAINAETVAVNEDPAVVAEGEVVEAADDADGDVDAATRPEGAAERRDPVMDSDQIDEEDREDASAEPVLVDEAAVEKTRG